MKYFHIFTQSCALPRFRKKKVFVKLTTFSTAKKTKNETKRMGDPEVTSEIKVTPPWTFSKCQQLFPLKKFCMETRLYNIFKRQNATKLARPILKSSHKVLLETILSVTLRQPVHLLRTVEFLATLNLQINITLVIF